MGQIKDINGNIVAEVEDLGFLEKPYLCVFGAVEPRHWKESSIRRSLAGDVYTYVRFGVNESVTKQLHEGVASVIATKEIIEHLGMSEDELFAEAIRNTPGRMKNIFDTVADLRGVEIPDFDKPPVFVVQSKDRDFEGAGILANMEYLSEVKKEIGDFYIIPSSQHEIIVIAKAYVDEIQMPLDYMKFMVGEVNGSVLAPEDKLTDMVFVFDSFGLRTA